MIQSLRTAGHCCLHAAVIFAVALAASGCGGDRRQAARWIVSFEDATLDEASQAQTHLTEFASAPKRRKIVVELLCSYAADRDEAPAVRSRCLEVLRGLKAREAVPALLDLLGDADYAVRTGAEDALVHIGGTDVVDALVTRTTDLSFAVRERAASALGRLKATVAVPALARMMKGHASAAAAGALGKIGGASAVSELREAARSDNPVLSTAAQRALSAIQRASG